MDRIAIIFARSGSKGLPGKNIREFNGKPLIAWSIIHALQIPRIQRIIVSTDSLEIASIASDFGAEIPFIRPKDLATDESPEWQSWKHALKFLEGESGVLPREIVSLPPTSPLRKIEDIEKCLDEMDSHLVDVVVTMSPSIRNPQFNMVKRDDRGLLHIYSEDGKVISRRQDAPESFDLSTVCYVARTDFVLRSNSMFEGSVRGVLVTKESSVDIDTLEDFEYAEYLIKKRNEIE